MWTSLLAVFGTLAGTLFGFALNEFSYIVRTRREDRRLLGRALNELLEIRNQSKMVPTLMETLRAQIPAAMPTAVDFELRKALREVTSNLVGDMQKRYEQTVSAVSEAFPVLAYELRSKDVLVPLLKMLAPFVSASDATAVEAFIKMEEEITRVSVPVIEDLIRRVASMCGKKTRREADAVLAARFELPRSTEKLFASVFSAAREVSNLRRAAARDTARKLS
jgi:hypothetical protein